MAGSASQGKHQHQHQQREAKDAKKKPGGSVPGKKRNWSADAPIFLKVREGGKRLSVTTNVVNRALLVFFGERGGHRTRSLALIDALSRSLLRIYFGRADKHCLSMVT
jgi:hypothetical protein